MTALAVLPESQRAAGLNPYEANCFSLHPLRLLNFFAPRLWGQTYDSSFWGRGLSTSIIGYGFWSQTIYLGLLAPLLVIAALARAHPDRRRALVFILIAAVLCVAAFGRHTPVLPWLMHSFEPLKLFRFPAKFFTFSSMLILCAAGLGLRESSALLGQDRSRRIAAVFSGTVLGVVLVVIISYVADSADYIKTASPRPDQSFLHIKQDIARLLILAAAVPAIALVLGRRELLARFALPLVLAGITAVDMLAALPAPPVNPRYDLYQKSEIAKDIKQIGPGRLIGFEQGYYLLKIGPRTSIRPNWGILDGVEYGLGKTAILPLRISNLDNVEIFKQQSSALFRILAVRYVISPINPKEDWVRKLEVEGVLEEAKSYPDYNLALYKTRRTFPRMALTRSIELVSSRGQALNMALADKTFIRGSPRVYIPMDSALFQGKVTESPPAPPLPPEGTAGDGGSFDRIIRVDRPDGDRELIEVELSSPGVLVVREYFMKGWHAEIDSEQAPIYYADGVGRALFLDAGHHQIRFYFKLPGLFRGGLISAITAITLAIGAMIYPAINKHLEK
jgi:hypothetical protein